MAELVLNYLSVQELHVVDDQNVDRPEAFPKAIVLWLFRDDTKPYMNSLPSDRRLFGR